MRAPRRGPHEAATVTHLLSRLSFHTWGGVHSKASTHLRPLLSSLPGCGLRDGRDPFFPILGTYGRVLAHAFTVRAENRLSRGGLAGVMRPVSSDRMERGPPKS